MKFYGKLKKIPFVINITISLTAFYSFQVNRFNEYSHFLEAYNSIALTCDDKK